MNPYTQSLRWALQRPDVAAEGLGWYRAAELLCRRLARETGLSFRAVAGTVAALSPRVSWATQVKYHGPWLRGERKSYGLGAQTRKAELIRDGADPIEVLSGPKVRAFYLAISGDSRAVVLDSWMIRAAGLGESGLTPRRYRELAAALIDAADEAGVAPREAQAAIWVLIRSTWPV